MTVAGSDFWVGVAWVMGSGLVVLIPVFFLVRALRNSAARAALHGMRSHLHGIRILLWSPQARFRGLRRSWDSQWRGVGVLALTEDGLYFRPAENQVDLRIPLGRIIRVEAKSGATETGHRPRRLQVHYHGVDDTERVATWSGIEVERWLEQISSLLEERSR